MKTIMDIAQFINNNDVIGTIAVLCSIISLLMTIKVYHSLRKSNERKFYNENHTNFVEQFSTMKNHLTSDGHMTQEIQSNIYALLISIESQCSSVFTLKDKYVMSRFKAEVKKDSLNCSKSMTIQYLAYWIGRLQKKADD